MPQPPNLEPEDVDGLLGALPCDIPGCDPLLALELNGEPGTVTNPDGAIIWVVNLDGVLPPVTTPVEPDGSFNVLVDGDILILNAGGLSEEYRLQVRAGDFRSEPIDFVVDLAGRTLIVSERPLASCFSIEPQTEILFGEVSVTESLEVVLNNDCDQTLTLVAPRLRATAPSFLVGTGPTSLDSGQTVSVSIDFAPEQRGLIEEIVMFEVVTPTRDRRPVTLSGLGAAD